jgi:hypothetical protein
MRYRYTSSNAARRNNGARGGTVAIVAAALVAGLCLAPRVHAQYQYHDPYDRYDRNGHWDAYTRLAEIDAGSFITVRTEEPIDTERGGERAYRAVVDRDVWDEYQRLAVPAIPRGSPAELLVRTARDGDLRLDLATITVGEERYEVAAQSNRIERGERTESGDRAAEYLGGGALIGTIIGAIAGGGKGAAVGAAAGAGAGAVGLLTTHGREVRVPPGSLLTFRLERPLSIEVSHRRQ